jgi:hypothetical protein
VLVRHQTLMGRVRRWIRQRRAPDGLELLESDADAVPVGEAPGSPGPWDGRPGRGAGGPPPSHPSESESADP